MAAIAQWDMNVTEILLAQPEEAMDTIIEWLECELLDGSERITLHAVTADVDPAQHGWLSDPLWRDGNDAIKKTFCVAELEETRARWTRMCRSIKRIALY